MIIKTNGLNLKITESMKNQIDSKLEPLDKFINKDTEISVKVTQKKLEIKIVIMLVYNGKLVKITKRDSDFYVGLEKATDILKTEIKKLHKLKVKRDNDQSKTIRTYFTEDIEEELDEPKIVKRKHILLHPMTEEDAIKEMENLGHNAFVFLNIDAEGCVCMIYKRNDGNYGILEDNI